MSKKVSDLHGYALFAHVYEEDGSVTGHRVVLTDEQVLEIEAIVTSLPVRLMEEASYDLVDEED